MTSINQLTGNPTELWQNPAVQKNLETIIKYKRININPTTGDVTGSSAKRNFIAKFFHDRKMDKQSSYFEKQVRAAVQQYNATVAAVTKPAFADPAKNKAQIDAEKKKLSDAQAAVTKCKAEQAKLLAPVNALATQKETTQKALKQVGLTPEVLKEVGDLKAKVDSFDGQALGLEAEKTRLNADNSNLMSKYNKLSWGWNGIRTFVVGYTKGTYDKEASMKMIEDKKYSDKVTKELKADVNQVIDNWNRIAEIPGEMTKALAERDEANVTYTEKKSAAEKILTDNNQKDGLTRLNSLDMIRLELSSLEKQVAEKSKAINSSNEFVTLQSQLNAATAAVKEAEEQLKKLGVK